MYFITGWPQTLDCDEAIQQIIPSHDQSLFLLVSSESLTIWNCRPSLKIVDYQRTDQSIEKYGENTSACWKSDSTKIIVQTTKNFLLFYDIIMNDQSTLMQSFDPKRNSTTDYLFEKNPIMSLILELKISLLIEEEITCIMSAEEEIVISTKNGFLHGVEWNGKRDENFCLNISIPSNNLHHQKKDQDHSSHPPYITNFKYSTIIGGFSLVFSNGFGGFFPLNESSHSTEYSQLQLINHVENALCTVINHKYAFIVFGLNTSEAVACDYDEINRRFVISFRLTLPSSVYPDAEKTLGPMTSLLWTPDSTVLASIWSNGGFALWSVFGSLLTCSISWSCGALENDSKLSNQRLNVSSLAFGKEGFQLWMVVNDTSKDTKISNKLCKFSMAKSVLAANPCSSVSFESVLLLSEKEIFVGGNKNSSQIAQTKLIDDEMTSSSHKDFTDSGINFTSKNCNNFVSEQSETVDSFQWITIQLPQSYLETNWPIRLFAIDSQASQNIAIAGSNGFAMYSLTQRRWKLFGNINHERDIIVTGGFLWFHDYLISGCYNISEDSFEIRAHSHREKLDNANAKIITIEQEVQLLSLYRSRLLALCSNGSIYLFDLHLFKRNHQFSVDCNYEINISAPIRVVIENLEIFPDCITVCLLTDLHMYHSPLLQQSEQSQRLNSIQSSVAARSHSILINICGRVLLLEMDIDITNLPISSDDDEDSDLSSISSKQNLNMIVKQANGSDYASIKFKKVVKLASNVENLWVLPHDETQLNAFRPSSFPYQSRFSFQLRPHLVTSLYLSCGSQGMAIWLSLEHSIFQQQNLEKSHLYNNTDRQEHTYISKRIMLNLNEIDTIHRIYPLAVRFRDAIVLGAESDFTQPNLSHFCRLKDDFFYSLVPYCVIKRTSQVYLHYILRELLRRNLGYRAWEIANTCSALPHFVHSLELLLHGVLEEEASSSQPLPDALLPRVVEFIKAFPVFLKTVIHCARKTELALWPHLFSIVGSPKDLFNQCLLDGQFETASSYIIVLQNLEKPEVATKCASRLLQASRVAGCWVTVKELKRFLRATNHAEENQEVGKNNSDISRERCDSSSSPNILSESSSSTKERSSTTGSNVNKVTTPGAAIKSNHFEFERTEITNEIIEENVVMQEAAKVEKTLNGDNMDSLTSQKSIDSLKKEEVLVVPQIYQSTNICRSESFEKTRAYPGTILRMMSTEQNDQFNNANNSQRSLFEFSYIKNGKASSSISSISSSTLSSSSVSSTPVQQQHRQNISENHRQPSNLVKMELTNNHFNKSNALTSKKQSIHRALSIDNQNQCTVS